MLAIHHLPSQLPLLVSFLPDIFMLESVFFVIVEFLDDYNEKSYENNITSKQHSSGQIFNLIMILKSQFAIIWNFRDMPILTYLLTKTRTMSAKPNK